MASGVFANEPINLQSTPAELYRAATLLGSPQRRDAKGQAAAHPLAMHEMRESPNDAHHNGELHGETGCKLTLANC